MEYQTEVIKILIFVALVIAFPVALVSWYRMLRAKTCKDYLKNVALFFGPILLVFVLASGVGLSEFPNLFEIEPPPTAPDPLETLGIMPKAQLTLLILAACIWLIGGYVLFNRHNKRVGKTWWQSINPLNRPFKEFNSREWSILGVLVVATFVVAGLAMSLNEAPPLSPNNTINYAPSAPDAAELRRLS